MTSKETKATSTLGTSDQLRPRQWLVYAREHVKVFVLVVAIQVLYVWQFFTKLRPSIPQSNSVPVVTFLSELDDERVDNVGHVAPRLTDGFSPGFAELVDLPFFDSGSMTAFLPVAHSTLEGLHKVLEPLLSDRSSVSAIVIVCPTSIVPALHEMLNSGHIYALLDISFALWPEGLDEGAAILNAAAHASTEYSFVLDSGGFGNLHEESREHLLSHPLLVDVPTGLCGGHFASAKEKARCVPPLTEPEPASLLLPPFVIPSSLIRGFNASMGHGASFWDTFGRNMLDTYGIGALVRESEKPSDKDWCYALCQKFKLIDGDSRHSQCSPSTTVDEKTITSDDLLRSNSLAIILQSLDSLKDFSSVACTFLQSGYDVHVLILSHDWDDTVSHDNSFPWFHDHLISSVCEISYSALHSSSNNFANAEAASFWLKSANETMSIIIYGKGDAEDYFDHIFAAELHSQTSLGITVIQIAQSDLSYCDWIASLTLAELRNWHAPRIEISVITDNRSNSLERLLKSLQNARYYGDSPSLRINVEQTADVETRKLVDELHWHHGDVFVHHRVLHAGLLAAVVESWYPSTNHSYGVLLEDDVEVSPLFYAWVKIALLRYRYGSNSNKRSSLFGISLYQQKQIELRPEGRRPFSAQTLFDSYGILYRNTPYLSQIPCSWGAVYFPEHWREFHNYLMVRFSEAWLPLREHAVPHVRSNRWAKSWKRFFIELAFLRGYVMLYPNYNDFVSLSTNHLEVGSHVKEQPRSIYEQKKALFTVPLMMFAEKPIGSDGSHATGLLELPEEQLPAWSDLPVLDLLGHISSESEIEERGRERQGDLVGCRTIGSQIEHHRPFEAEELFTCIGTAEDESDAEDDFDDRD